MAKEHFFKFAFKVYCVADQTLLSYTHGQIRHLSRRHPRPTRREHTRAATIDLLHQWYARLVNAFACDVGVYYSGEKKVLPLTVTTYHSAGDLMAESGNAFKLIIFDEVHHLPAPSWGEAALMAPAPFRLGLTATYPEDHEQTNGRWRVDDLVGPIVYTKPIQNLTRHHPPHYRTQHLPL